MEKLYFCNIIGGTFFFDIKLPFNTLQLTNDRNISKMKKILILGASGDQVPLIKAAKELGLYVVCCDYTDDNPGLSMVDKHYKVDYKDKKTVLEIGQKEHVDGVFSNSERAMECVAYVVDGMGLFGNSLDCVEALMDKNRFRSMLKRVGVFSPACFLAKDLDELFKGIQNVKFPIIIKPCVGSASRGIQVIEKYDEPAIVQAFDECMKYTWNGQVEIEEFVPMPSRESIEGELFVYGDDIWFNGLFDVQRSRYYLMIPMAYSCPLKIGKERMELIKDVVTKAVKGSGLRFGEFNLEMYFTKDDDLFIIELNSRQGGRFLPQMVQKHNGIDYYKLLISLAVGDESYYNYLKSDLFVPQENCVSKLMVFGHKDGVLEDVYYSPEIIPHIEKKTTFINNGSTVKNTKNGTHAIAMVEMQFDNYEQQRGFMDNIEDFIYPIIK